MAFPPTEYRLSPWILRTRCSPCPRKRGAFSSKFSGAPSGAGSGEADKVGTAENAVLAYEIAKTAAITKIMNPKEPHFRFFKNLYFIGDVRQQRQCRAVFFH
jgi:hypothetical protein